MKLIGEKERERENESECESERDSLENISLIESVHSNFINTHIIY